MMNETEQISTQVPVLPKVERKDSKNLHSILKNFLRKNTIYEILPENSKVLVLNSEMSMLDAITALAEQNMFYSVVWNSQKKSFEDVLTLRDVLELFVFFSVNLQAIMHESGQHLDSVNLMPNSTGSDSKFIRDIIKTIISRSGVNTPYEGGGAKTLSEVDTTSPPELDEEGKSETTVVNEPNKKEITNLYEKNNTIMIMLLEELPLLEWVSISKDVIHYKPYNITSFNIDENLLTALEHMRYNNLHCTLILDEKHDNQINGLVTNELILSYIVRNLDGDAKEFERSVKDLEIGTYGSVIVTAYEDESLFQVLKKMKETRVSIIPIESRTTGHTIGLFFLSDVMYIMRVGSYYKMEESIISFVKDINDISEEEELAEYERRIEEVTKRRNEEFENESDEEDEGYQEDREGWDKIVAEGELSRKTSLKVEGLDQLQEEKKNGDTSKSTPLSDIIDKSPRFLKRKMTMDDTHKLIYGIDRVLLFRPEESVKLIVEKVMVAPDRRLVCLDRKTMKITGIISITDVIDFIAK